MTKIEWTHPPGYKGETWNPLVGCSRVSEGCRHCYAERMAKRLAAMGNEYYKKAINPRTGLWNGKVVEAPLHVWQLPLRWKTPRCVFVNSMGDVFHEAIDASSVPCLWNRMEADIVAKHRFLILTKRPRIMQAERCGRYASPNIGLGVSVESQAVVDRLDWLIRTPAAMRFVSIEPLIGPVEIDRGVLERLDWVIVGGESGPGARPCHPDWVRWLRDQCDEANVPFFFKQWGEWAPVTPRFIPQTRKEDVYVSPRGERKRCFADGQYPPDDNWAAMRRVGKATAGRLLDGVTHDEWPMWWFEQGGG